MSRTLWLDIDTFSKASIKNGTYTYAENVKIMLFSWAIDTVSAQVWNVTENTKIHLERRLALKDPDVLIYAHNSHFEG